MADVKPLNWIAPLGVVEAFVAMPMDDSGITYKVQKLFINGKYQLSGPGFRQQFETLDAAKQWAAIDWTRRVNALLIECNHVWNAVPERPGSSTSVAQCAKCGCRPHGPVSIY